MRIIILLSALVMSIAPAQAQSWKELTNREQTIFFSGMILGTSKNYCDFIKGGAGTEENRKEFLAVLLAEFKKVPATKGHEYFLDSIYEVALVCDEDGPSE